MDSITKWQVKFRAYISELNIPRDDYRGIMEYIEEVPAIKPRPKGRWIDYTDDGYVECPFCGSATNCDGNISELHYCFSCGADLKGGEKHDD